MKILFMAMLGLLGLHGFSQNRLIITPEKPEAGDTIHIEYTPGGDLSGNLKLPEAYALQFASTGNKIIDIPLKRMYGKLVGRIKTDTAASLLAFGFQIEGQYDNNQDSGFLVPLYRQGQVSAGSYAGKAAFFGQYGSRYFGVSAAPDKAVSFYEQEFALYPESKEKYSNAYLRAGLSADKVNGTAAVQNEIENTLKSGLDTKADFEKIISLYNMAGLRQQRMFFTRLQHEKFPASPSDSLGPASLYARFTGAKDLQTKAQLLDQALGAADTSQNKEAYSSYITYFQRNLLSDYAAANDWDRFQSFAAGIKDEKLLARAYNSAAWKLQEAGEAGALAQKLAGFATGYARKQWEAPTEPKPDMMTAGSWAQSRKYTYASYADTYARVLHKAGKNKKALHYAKDAALLIQEGRNPDFNATYALIAAKALPARKFVPVLEQFVREGKASSEITEILKKQYKEKKEGDFDQYIAALEKEAYTKMLAGLRENMLNMPVPEFSLTDLEGRTVSLADYKDKVVVLDFWATWCGPCKASFPAMKKMVEKYEADPKVAFLFVNTWQPEEDKLKNAKDFIIQNNYGSFHVLLDNEDKVVKDFEVSGIPTKFIIGADGTIRFKSIGFEGAENLLKELPAMIELAGT